MNLLTLFFDIFVVSFIGFSLLMGFFLVYFSPPDTRYHGLLLIIIGIIAGLFFYYFYAYSGNLWQRVPVIETIFSGVGALLGMVVVVGIAAILLLFSRKR